MGEVILEMKGIDKSFPGVHALDHVDLEIRKGEVLALMGENGAGKSTMLRMLLGMYDKMQGNIYIDGIDVVKNRTQIKNITGVVSQERTFFMEEDAYENERLYAPFYRNWNSGEYRKMLKNLNINSGRSLGNLSTGEMLKYQLAFAAAYRPQVLLLDEPTANLDPVFRDDFLKILQEFVAEYDMTILMATHLDEDISKLIILWMWKRGDIHLGKVYRMMQICVM